MGEEQLATKETRPRSLPPPYSSKIIKAGALLADTKTLLAHWDLRDSVQGNVDRVRRENLFGKASRSRVEDVLAIFRQRILGERSVTSALVVLVRKRLPAAA
ncbi:MAG TPA: BrxA family protein, partial [Pirellulales bacterium]|nr:BrxA family protein [Pirellulales bacterium]